jgi:hypothetical protein
MMENTVHPHATRIKGWTQVNCGTQGIITETTQGGVATAPRITTNAVRVVIGRDSKSEESFSKSLNFNRD